MGFTETRTEGTTDGGLCHIPLDDVVFRHTRLAEGGHRPRTASTKGTNDNHSRQTASLLGAVFNRSLDISNQSILVGVARNAWEGLAVVQLPCPDLKREGSTGESSVESKRLEYR